jgi:hypothetical protein
MFSLAGTVGDCVTVAQRYSNAGVTELALTFSGPNAVREIDALGQAVKRHSC